MITFNADGDYYIDGETKTSNDVAFSTNAQNTFSDNVWSNYLSNAVILYYLTNSNTSATTLNATPSKMMSFYSDNAFNTAATSRATKVNLLSNFSITNATPQTKYFYYLMDYSVDFIDGLYSYITNTQDFKADLSTRIAFASDIYFTVGKEQN